MDNIVHVVNPKKMKTWEASNKLTRTKLEPGKLGVTKPETSPSYMVQDIWLQTQSSSSGGCQNGTVHSGTRNLSY